MMCYFSGKYWELILTSARENEFNSMINQTIT